MDRRYIEKNGYLHRENSLDVAVGFENAKPLHHQKPKIQTLAEQKNVQ